MTVKLLILFVVILGVTSHPINLNQTSVEESSGELQLLQIITRHGDRTPYWIYKNDRYKEDDFWEGIGQLVNKGKERLFDFGTVLRERYHNYVENIRIKNIRAQSSPIRRCVETNLAMLAGFIPPSKEAVWSNKTSWPETVLSKIWQPIAVETVEESRSWKLNPDAICPAASKIEKDMEIKVPELKKFLEENHEFIKSVGNYSGEDFFGDLNWLWVGYLFDTEFTQKEYFEDRYLPPSWLNKIGNDTMERLSKFNDMVFSIYEKAPDFLKLRCGTFLKEVIDNMQNEVKLMQNTGANKKLFTYGSHDTMIAYILHSLGMFKAQPSYGSGIIFELRKNLSSSESQVHLFYANVTNNFEIYPMKLNESARFSSRCKFSYCSLSNFAASLVDYLENDVEKNCQL